MVKVGTGSVLSRIQHFETGKSSNKLERVYPIIDKKNSVTQSPPVPIKIKAKEQYPNQGSDDVERNDFGRSKQSNYYVDSTNKELTPSRIQNGNKKKFLTNTSVSETAVSPSNRVRKFSSSPGYHVNSPLGSNRLSDKRDVTITSSDAGSDSAFSLIDTNNKIHVSGKKEIRQNVKEESNHLFVKRSINNDLDAVSTPTKNSSKQIQYDKFRNSSFSTENRRLEKHSPSKISPQEFSTPGSNFSQRVSCQTDSPLRNNSLFKKRVADIAAAESITREDHMDIDKFSKPQIPVSATENKIPDTQDPSSQFTLQSSVSRLNSFKKSPSMLGNVSKKNSHLSSPNTKEGKNVSSPYKKQSSSLSDNPLFLKRIAAVEKSSKVGTTYGDVVKKRDDLQDLASHKVFIGNEKEMKGDSPGKKKSNSNETKNEPLIVEKKVKAHPIKSNIAKKDEHALIYDSEKLLKGEKSINEDNIVQSTKNLTNSNSQLDQDIISDKFPQHFDSTDMFANDRHMMNGHSDSQTSDDFFSLPTLNTLFKEVDNINIIDASHSFESFEIMDKDSQFFQNDEFELGKSDPTLDTEKDDFQSQEKNKKIEGFKKPKGTSLQNNPLFLKRIALVNATEPTVKLSNLAKPTDVPFDEGSIVENAPFIDNNDTRKYLENSNNSIHSPSKKISEGGGSPFIKEGGPATSLFLKMLTENIDAKNEKKIAQNIKARSPQIKEESEVTKNSDFSENEVPRSPYDEAVMEDEDIYQMIVAPKILGANETLTTSPIPSEMLVDNKEVEEEEKISQSVDTNFPHMISKMKQEIGLVGSSDFLDSNLKIAMFESDESEDPRSDNDEAVWKCDDMIKVIPKRLGVKESFTTSPMFLKMLAENIDSKNEEKITKDIKNRSTQIIHEVKEEHKVTRSTNFLENGSKDAMVESCEIEVPRSPYDEVVMEDEDIYQMIVSPKNLGANETLTTSPILPEMLVENEEVEVEEIVSQSVDTNFPQITSKMKQENGLVGSSNFLDSKVKIAIVESDESEAPQSDNDEVVMKASERDLMVTVPHKMKLLMQENSRVATKNDSNDEDQTEANRDLNLNTVASVSSFKINAMENSPKPISDNNESPDENQLLATLPWNKDERTNENKTHEQELYPTNQVFTRSFKNVEEEMPMNDLRNNVFDEKDDTVNEIEQLHNSNLDRIENIVENNGNTQNNIIVDDERQERLNPTEDGFIISTSTHPTNKSVPFDELSLNQRQLSEFPPSNQVSTKSLNEVEEEVPINDLYMNSFVEKGGTTNETEQLCHSNFDRVENIVENDGNTKKIIILDEEKNNQLYNPTQEILAPAEEKFIISTSTKPMDKSIPFNELSPMRRLRSTEQYTTRKSQSFSPNRHHTVGFNASFENEEDYGNEVEDNNSFHIASSFGSSDSPQKFNSYDVRIKESHSIESHEEGFQYTHSGNSHKSYKEINAKFSTETLAVKSSLLFDSAKLENIPPDDSFKNIERRTDDFDNDDAFSIDTFATKETINASNLKKSIISQSKDKIRHHERRNKLIRRELLDSNASTQGCAPEGILFDSFNDVSSWSSNMKNTVVSVEDAFDIFDGIEEESLVNDSKIDTKLNSSFEFESSFSTTTTDSFGGHVKGSSDDCSRFTDQNSSVEINSQSRREGTSHDQKKCSDKICDRKGDIDIGGTGFSSKFEDIFNKKENNDSLESIIDANKEQLSWTQFEAVDEGLNINNEGLNLFDEMAQDNSITLKVKVEEEKKDRCTLELENSCKHDTTDKEEKNLKNNDLLSSNFVQSSDIDTRENIFLNNNSIIEQLSWSRDNDLQECHSTNQQNNKSMKDESNAGQIEESNAGQIEEITSSHQYISTGDEDVQINIVRQDKDLDSKNLGNIKRNVENLESINKDAIQTVHKTETSECILYDDDLCLDRKIPEAKQKDINPDVALKRVEQVHASLEKLKSFDIEENQNNVIKEIASTKEKDEDCLNDEIKENDFTDYTTMFQKMLENSNLDGHLDTNAVINKESNKMDEGQTSHQGREEDNSENEKYLKNSSQINDITEEKIFSNVAFELNNEAQTNNNTTSKVHKTQQAQKLMGMVNIADKSRRIPSPNTKAMILLPPPPPPPPPPRSPPKNNKIARYPTKAVQELSTDSLLKEGEIKFTLPFENDAYLKNNYTINNNIELKESSDQSLILGQMYLPSDDNEDIIPNKKNDSIFKSKSKTVLTTNSSNEESSQLSGNLKNWWDQTYAATQNSEVNSAVNEALLGVETSTAEISQVNIEDNEEIEQIIMKKDVVIKAISPISHTESRELSLLLKGSSIKTACTDDEDVFDGLDEDELTEPNLKEKKFKVEKVKPTKEMKAELHPIPKVVEANVDWNRAYNTQDEDSSTIPSEQLTNIKEQEKKSVSLSTNSSSHNLPNKDQFIPYNIGAEVSSQSAFLQSQDQTGKHGNLESDVDTAVLGAMSTTSEITSSIITGNKLQNVHHRAKRGNNRFQKNLLSSTAPVQQDLTSKQSNPLEYKESFDASTITSAQSARKSKVKRDKLGLVPTFTDYACGMLPFMGKGELFLLLYYYNFFDYLTKPSFQFFQESENKEKQRKIEKYDTQSAIDRTEEDDNTNTSSKSGNENLCNSEDNTSVNSIVSNISLSEKVRTI